MEELLAALKTLFIKLFQPFLATFVASLHVASTAKLSSSTDTSRSWNFQKAFDGWEAVFDKLLRGLEDKAAQVCPPHFPACHSDLELLSRRGAHVSVTLPDLRSMLCRPGKTQTRVRPFEIVLLQTFFNLLKVA